MSCSASSVRTAPGKTTTISILCTLLRPSGGSATVAGHDVATDPGGVRSSIGLVFQEITLDDYLTGAENLRFHAVLYGYPAAQVAERAAPLLEMVGLTDRADQQVRFYSGGMKRRLEIARGFCTLHACCSSTSRRSGSIPQTRAHIWEYVDLLREREATTMFLTTHYMDEAERCDRIAIIDQGRIVAIDTPDALKSSVGADTVTLATSDDATAREQIKSGLGIDGELTDEGLRLRVPEGESMVPQLFPHLSVGVHNVAVHRPSLDDVFMEYTGRAIRDARSRSGRSVQDERDGPRLPEVADG